MYSIEITNLHLLITVQFFCILRRFLKSFKDKYLTTASYVTPLIVISHIPLISFKINMAVY